MTGARSSACRTRGALALGGLSAAAQIIRSRRQRQSGVSDRVLHGEHRTFAVAAPRSNDTPRPRRIS